MPNSILKFSKDLINLNIQETKQFTYVSNFGNVSAGFPSPAEDYATNDISLDELYLEKPEATFVNRVAGDSMYPDYQIGDLLIIRSDLEPRHLDDIVISLNSSEYTLKRYDADNKKLIALNPKYKNAIQLQDGDTVVILGVVTNLIRCKRK